LVSWERERKTRMGLPQKIMIRKKVR